MLARAAALAVASSDDRRGATTNGSFAPGLRSKICIGVSELCRIPTRDHLMIAFSAYSFCSASYGDQRIDALADAPSRSMHVE